MTNKIKCSIINFVTLSLSICARSKKDKGFEMDINIKPILSGEKRKIEFSFILPLEYSENGCALTSDAVVSGEVVDKGGYMELSAICKASYATECARCLKKLEREFEIRFDRPVAVSLQSDNEEEEYILVGENSNINIDEPIGDELLLSLPYRTLCKDDCKGLCPKCGCDLNEKQCACPTKEPDPRWAVLKNFKPKSEEDK